MPLTCPTITPTRCSPRRLWFLLLLTATTISFVAGHAVGFHAGRNACQDEDRGRFEEFLRVGVELGVVQINYQRLDEVLITINEAAWEDRDAEEWRPIKVSLRNDRGDL